MGKYYIIGIVAIITVIMGLMAYNGAKRTIEAIEAKQAQSPIYDVLRQY